MKKTYVIILLVIVLVLWLFCWLYFGKNKQDNFENDLKCQEKLDDYSKELKAKWYTNISVFYSPIENSCLWTFQSYNLYDNETRYNSYSYTIEKLSDLHKYAYFDISYYYSWNDLIGIKHITDNFTDKECSDIDYRVYERSEEDKEYYNNTKRCKFDNIEEAYQEELEYLKGN